MSAERLRLRDAAALLRERAEMATAATGQWSVSYIPEGAVPNAHIIDRWFVMDRFENGQETGPYAQCEYEPAAYYVAMMSPPVALALADWLDAEAALLEAQARHPSLHVRPNFGRITHAQAVSNSILGDRA